MFSRDELEFALRFFVLGRSLFGQRAIKDAFLWHEPNGRTSAAWVIQPSALASVANIEQESIRGAAVHLRLDENRTGRWGVDDVMAALMQKAESEGVDGISGDMIDSYYDDELVLPGSNGRRWSDDDFRDGERSRILINFLHKLGYDSIIYQNEFEGGGDSYLLLDAHQVKSATDNVGTFDPSDPSILKNRRT